MTLKELYAKVPVSKHPNIRVIEQMVIYDDGVNIYQAYIDQEGELVPANNATRNALKAL